MPRSVQPEPERYAGAAATVASTIAKVAPSRQRVACATRARSQGAHGVPVRTNARTEDERRVTAARSVRDATARCSAAGSPRDRCTSGSPRTLPHLAATSTRSRPGSCSGSDRCRPRRRIRPSPVALLRIAAIVAVVADPAFGNVAGRREVAHDQALLCIGKCGNPRRRAFSPEQRAGLRVNARVAELVTAEAHMHVAIAAAARLVVAGQQKGEQWPSKQNRPSMHSGCSTQRHALVLEPAQARPAGVRGTPKARPYRLPPMGSPGPADRIRSCRSRP